MLEKPHWLKEQRKKKKKEKKRAWRMISEVRTLDSARKAVLWL